MHRVDLEKAAKQLDERLASPFVLARARKSKNRVEKKKTRQHEKPRKSEGIRLSEQLVLVRDLFVSGSQAGWLAGSQAGVLLLFLFPMLC